MNINTDQLIQRLEHGIALLKESQSDFSRQQKVLITISALAREYAKQLNEKECEYETQ
jgi:hypothetical protein